jgi:hypothetical protein
LGSPLVVKGVGEDNANKKFVYAMNLHFAGSEESLIFTRGEKKEKWTSKKGEIKQVLLTPNGSVDGILLKDFSAVRFPPISSDQAKLLFPGTPVEVGGPTAENQIESSMILIPGRDWVFVAGDNHQHINVGVPPGMVRDTPDQIAELPPGAPAEAVLPTEKALKPVTKKGKIDTILRSPSGLADTLIFSDGTVAKLSPKVSPTVVDKLRKGDFVRVAGDGGRYPLGTALQASDITRQAS